MSLAVYQPFPTLGLARGHIWRHQPATRRPRHFHAEPELNLVTAGSGKFGVGMTEIEVSAGDLLWWTPGQDHELLEASPDFDLFVIGLTSEFSDRVLGDQSSTIYRGPALVRIDPSALMRFQQFCAAPVGRQDVTVIERHVGDFWREAQSHRSSAPNMHVLTRRSLAALLQCPDLDRDRVADLAGGYPSEVSRHFHKDMGVTLATYRTRLRLLRFIDRVDAGSDSLLAAALDAGFGSYSQCQRSFQQTLACTPKVYFATAIRQRMEEAFAPTGKLAAT